MNEKMNKKINPAHSDVQGDKTIIPPSLSYIEKLDFMKRYLRDTVQREHSAEWWSIVFAFVSHYKEA